MILGKILGITRGKKISTSFSQSIHGKKWRKNLLFSLETRKLSIFTDSMIIIDIY